MSILYLDSSAVVKIYIPETGSPWVKSLVEAVTPEGVWKNENRALVASKLPPLTFISADNVLCKAAKEEGLPTENSNDH